MTINDVLAPFRHPLSWPAYKAVREAHEAGLITAQEWADYRAEIEQRGDSWLGYMRWNRNGGSMPEDRIDDHLREMEDRVECPYCGHALDELSDGRLACGNCDVWFSDTAQVTAEAATLAAAPFYGN